MMTVTMPNEGDPQTTFDNALNRINYCAYILKTTYGTLNY